MNASLVLPVIDPTGSGAARRAAATWASERGWGEEMVGRVALVVTELSRNLALHTVGGVLLLRHLRNSKSSGVEILSLDSSPGVANFQECLRDGYSTAGTSGIGLGAVSRISNAFAVHSQLGLGTALRSEIWEKPFEAEKGSWECGAVNVAFAREPVCGDSWQEQAVRPDVLRVMIADGLGHGEFAAAASQRACEILLANGRFRLPEVLEAMHGALRATRGAAVAVAEIDLQRQVVDYCGIGNISASIVTHEGSTSLISLNGTVGAQTRGFRLFSYAWPKNAALVMSSDGLKSQWKLSRYSGLLERHPGLVAGVLYRDYARTTDDVTVLVVRSSL